MQHKKATATRRPLLPGHPSWGEFIERLAGPEACNFHTDGWTCFGDLRFATRILREIGLDEPSIDASAAWFKSRGGYCDCEVIFNVDPPG